jgi:hypothetical protein
MAAKVACIDGLIELHIQNAERQLGCVINKFDKLAANYTN